MNSNQKPIHSGFSAASTTNDVIKGIDLTGKTVIVTGGYAGLGLETTMTLSSAGAKVIVPARDVKKAQENLKGLPRVTVEEMDLMNPESVKSFAEKFLSKNNKLDILINNAGIMWVPLKRDSRGHESQFSTNHLGHFQLTLLLHSALKAANGARVINVSSWGHRFTPFRFDDYDFVKTPFETLLGYGQSKSANILFTVELDKRWAADGIRAFSLHPGSIVDTDLKRYASQDLLNKAGVFDEKGEAIRDPARGLKTIEQGAATQVWCATSPQLKDLGGLYCENVDVADVISPDGVNEFKTADATRVTGVMDYAIDSESAKKLWVLSERLLGI